MHRCDFRLPVRVLAAAALPLMGAATLAGCSGASQHQVIDRNVACSSCHSDEKPVYEGATVPSETVESGSRVQVKTSGAAVAVVARPVFTAEDGSGFVPVIDSSVALDGGEAVVELGTASGRCAWTRATRLAPSSCASIPRAMRPLSWNCSARTLSAARE